MKIVKRIIKTTLFLVIAMIGLLIVYSFNPGKPLAEMEEIIILDDSVEVTSDFDEIRYEVSNPKGNIIFIPGGKVTAESYKYLATGFANDGYNVTIFKAILNLSILTGNYPERFVDSDLENIIIGHSLGGITASNIAVKGEIDKVILLGSYSLKDLSSLEVLVILGELDSVIDLDTFKENEDNLGEYTLIEIVGGNHAQFGWYGEQNKDTAATISTKEQQDQIIEGILDFLNS